MITLRDAAPDNRNAVITAVPGGGAATATPGAETSIFYKFGMSPKLWLLVLLAAGGGFFIYKKVRR